MGTQERYAGAHTKKLLFLTNSESSQANTILAMAHEAATRSYVEVHVASFQTLKRRVERFDPKLNFHALDGKAMVDVEMPVGKRLSVGGFAHLPTRKSFVPYGRDMGTVLAGWDGESGF